MKAKKYTAGMLVLSGALLLAACGKQPAAPDKVYVGVASYDGGDVFIGELIDCLKEQLNGFSGDGMETTVTVRDAAGSQRTQNDQVKALIDEGSNVLCINLVDRADPSEIIDLARENDVPVIFFNREPVAEDMMQWEKLYYVGADAKQSGVMQGELAAELIRSDSRVDRNRDGKIQYVVLEGEPGHQDSIIRTENAVDTLKNNGIELEKLSYGIANWNRAQAQNRMMQMIGQHSNEIELVLANNDDMALGAIDAMERMGAKDIQVVGIDGTIPGIEAVESGKMLGTVSSDKEKFAWAIFSIAADKAMGQPVREELQKELEEGKYYRGPQKIVEIGQEN